MAKRKSKSLAAYRAKRNFDQTSEPTGPERRAAAHKKGASDVPAGRLFVVQKHRARRLHFDFRLELDGVLKSWAVPKGPSLTAGSKPLAVHVEDHPLDYAGFEGVIPAGQYGAGEVIVWDRGRWEPLADPHQGLAKGDLKFRLHGERLKGEWALVRMKPRANERGDGKNWLLIKKKDEGATGEDILAEETSVASGRTLDDVKAGLEAKASKKPARRPRDTSEAPAQRPAKAAKARPPDPSRLKGAVRREQPASLAPQLANTSTEPPAGDQWLHEIKYDGYRLVCMIRRGKVKLLTRSGQDWTGTFQPIADAVAELPLKDGVVDGEVVVLDRRAIPDFQALQNALKTRVRSVLVYYAFDLPFASGWDLRACKLEDRKALLHRVIPGAVAGNGAIRFSDHIRGRGADVFRRAFATGLEGIVSKRADAPYESRRTDTWRKIKCRRTDEFVIGGYTDPEGSREGLGALLLARPRDGRLVYFGKVGTGFDTGVLRDLTERLGKLERRTPGIEPPPNRADRVGVHWVEPVLVADVEYGSVTREGIVRHATYRGLRLDKPAAEVSDGPLEAPASLPDGGPTPEPVIVRPTRRPGAVMVGGVQVTNADRVVYPDADVTKLNVAEYYLAASDRMLPFVIDRPLSLLRSPKGISGQAFFQRHPMESFPKSVDEVRVPGHDGRYLMIHDREGLMALVQFGTIEFHPWHCKSDSPQTPDFITIDLDPGPGVPWEGVIAAAMAMRQYLEGEGVESWIKTSGGKGLHIVSSLDGTATWNDVKAFTGRLADTISRAAPARFTASATADRRGRIFIDHLRNRSSATSVAAYSLRARPGAAVSAPISWDELRRCPGPAAFTIRNMGPRLAAPDPWKGFWTRRSALPKAAG